MHIHHLFLAGAVCVAAQSALAANLKPQSLVCRSAEAIAFVGAEPGLRDLPADGILAQARERTRSTEGLRKLADNLRGQVSRDTSGQGGRMEQPSEKIAREAEERAAQAEALSAKSVAVVRSCGSSGHRVQPADIVERKKHAPAVQVRTEIDGSMVDAFVLQTSIAE